MCIICIFIVLIISIPSVEVMAEDVVDSQALVVLQEVDSKSWEYNGGLIIHIDVSS